MGRSLGVILIGDYKAQLRPLEITTKALQNTNVVDLFEELDGEEIHRGITECNLPAQSSFRGSEHKQSNYRWITTPKEDRSHPTHKTLTTNQLNDPPKLAQVHQLHHNHELHDYTHTRSAPMHHPTATIVPH